MNRAIARAPTRDDLFRELCRAAVEHAGFRMAMVGWHDTASKRIVPVASAGDQDHYLESFSIYSRQALELRTGWTRFSDRSNVRVQRFPGPGDQSVGRRGEAPRNDASATFPIRLQSRVSGIFGVYSTQREYFQVAEVEFLEEIAGNVSHALDLFARENRQLRR